MTQAEKEAKQFERIKFARDNHNTTCPLGPAIEVHMNPFDIERMLWEEGDIIATLLLVGNPNVTTDRLRILCAGDKAADGPVSTGVVALPQPARVDVPDYVPMHDRELEPAHCHGGHSC